MGGAYQVATFGVGYFRIIFWGNPVETKKTIGGYTMDIQTIIDCLKSMSEDSSLLDYTFFQDEETRKITMTEDVFSETIKLLESLIWRDAEKDSPHKYSLMLAFGGDNYLVSYVEESGKWRCERDDDHIAVTHWLPLPEPPSTK
jgi:hypothetical protein